MKGIVRKAIHNFLFGVVRVLLYFFPVVTKNKKICRSLWVGTPIINMAHNAKAERLLGYQSDSLVFSSYFITKNFSYNFSSICDFSPIRIVLPYFILIWACAKYQRFHFYCDGGIVPSLRRFETNEDELKLLNLLGKQVFFWTYGADVRTLEVTRELGSHHCCMYCNSQETHCICNYRRAKQNQNIISQYATAIFSMGDMTEYTLDSRNDLFFWPVDLYKNFGKKYSPFYPNIKSGRPVRIVHAPNHRKFKGTQYLINAVEHLQKSGCAIELQLVERVPNEQALELYRTADIIFDQCLIGFHGYFAIEAMAMGKPVVCYIRKPQEYLLHPEECPIVNCRADQVEDVLRSLCQDGNHLNELGRAGRKYVEKYFTLEAFAQRLKNTYKDIGVL